MRHRIRSIPVRSLENDVVFLKESKEKEEVKPLNQTTENILLDENANIAIGSDNIVMQQDMEKADINTFDVLNMHVDVNNTSEDIKMITTDDAKFYIKGEEIKNIYKKPMLLCKLKKGQNISFTAIAKLGIERISALFSALTIFAYTELTDNKFKVALESRGQLPEYKFLYVSCMNLLKHLEAFQDAVPKDNKGLNGELDIKNMSHTMGNLISHGMVRHNDVEFAGYAKPLLDEKVVIKFVLKKSNIYTVISEVIKYYKDVFTYLQNISNLNKEI